MRIFAFLLFLLPFAAPALERSSAAAALEETWGVQVVSTRLTAAGYMLDFRYRVVDAGKAAPLFRRQTKPHLIDEASGAKLEVAAPPKIGALRSSIIPENGRTYWMFFANPGKFLKPGAKVAVVIGEFKAEHLLVE